MTELLSQIENALIAEFSIENDRGWQARRGVMALSITGTFLRSVDQAELVAVIRAVVPRDSRLYSIDGHILRMRTWGRSYGGDQYFTLFTSKDFPLIKEGDSFRSIQPIYHTEKPSEYRADDEKPSTHVHVLRNSNLDTHEFIVNKATHVLEIPLERETEDQLFVVVRPKQDLTV